MARNASPEQVEELERLHAELTEAHKAAMEALRIIPPNYLMEGASATLFEAAEERVASIVRQIRKIQGK